MRGVFFETSHWQRIIWLDMVSLLTKHNFVWVGAVR